METRPIGSTGISLTRIGFGGAPLGDLRRAPSDAEAHELLQAAWDAGIRYFDTAPMYGNGLSERRLGDFLRDKPRDSYVLSSKVGRILIPDRAHALERSGGDPRALPFRYIFDFSRDAILRSHELSLQRLGLERIDILYLHDIGRFSQGDNHEATWSQLMEGGGLKALEGLRDDGTVKAIGAGVNEWPVLDELMNHARLDVCLLANRYTLLDQAVLDHFLPRCVKEGLAIVDGAPLNAGILATGAIEGASYDYRPAPPEILGISLTVIVNHMMGGTDFVSDTSAAIERLGEVAGNVLTFEPKPDPYSPIMSKQALYSVGWNARAQYFSDQEGSNLGAVLPEEGSVFQINSINLVKDAPNADAAKVFIDYALSPEAQAAFAKAMFYAPTNAKTELPEEVSSRTAAGSMDRMIEMSPLDLAAARERIMQEWRRNVISR